MLRWYEPVWLAFFANAALKSTVVLGAAWLITLMLRKRSAAARHVVWTAALAAVLALPFLSVGLPELRLPVNLPALTFQTTVTDTAAAEAALRSRVLPNAASAQPAEVAWRPDWLLCAMALWAAGTTFAFAQMIVAAAVMLRRRSKAARYIADEFTTLAAQLGIRMPVPVLESAPGSMPVTFGLWRPTIFLPADASQWSEERRRLVVLHELAHVRRGDLPAHIVARAALCLYWWHPLAWMAWREFLKEREHAADDLVLRTGARASDYAAHLLEVARSMQPAAAVGWAAVAMARRSQLEGRLLAILDSGVDRKTVGRASLVFATAAAVLFMAPLAAIHAQDPNENTVPADVDATIRAALAQKNHQILDNAAAAFERIRQYETAQMLLQTSLQIREQTAGQQSVEYGEGLAKLGDVAVRQRKNADAMDFYSRAALAIGDRPAAAHSLFQLGVLLMTEKQYDRAEENFRHMQTVDPSRAGEALTWIALTHEQRPDDAAQAESYYREALAVEDNASPEAAVTRRLLARFLRAQGRDAEAAQVAPDTAPMAPPANIAAFRGTTSGQPSAAVTTPPPPPPPPPMTVRAQTSPGTYHVGGGVTAPVVLHKFDPEYSETARAAKYQGTVLLYVEIGPDGRAHNIQVTRGLGLGLDEKAVEAIGEWQFKPGMKEGQPVTVAATIEVNFRLM